MSVPHRRRRLARLPWRGALGLALVAAALPVVARGEGDAAPEFVQSVGATAPKGLLNDPRGVAVSPTDNEWIYVVDRGNARVQVLTPTGQPVGAWGRRGNGTGEFWDPIDIDVSPDGRYVYVVDRGHSLIKRFSPEYNCFTDPESDCFSGSSVKQWGGKGTGDGLFDTPTGLAVDGAGRVYVSDWAAHNVEVFDADGAFLGRFGEPGAENGQLMRPTDIAVGPDGRIWIADRDNDRIAIFEFDGSTATYFGSYDAGGTIFHPTGLAVDRSGDFLVLDYDPSYRVPRVRRFDSEKHLVDGPRGMGGDFAPALYPLLGAAFLQGGSAVVADPFAAEDSLTLLSPGGEPYQLATRSRQLGQMDNPGAVAVDPHFVVVSDVGNHRVLVLDPSEDYRTIAVMGGVFHDFDLPQPGGLAVHRYGDRPEEAVVYIASPGVHNVYVSTGSGQRIDVLGDGSPGAGCDGLRGPSSVTVGPEGDLFIADTLNHRIVHRGPYPDHGFLNTIGGPGSGDGELTFPRDVAVGPDGLIYTLEQGKSRLQAFTPDGQHVRTWDELQSYPQDGVPPGYLWFPVSLSSDGEYLYIMEDDGLEHVRVQVFKPRADEGSLVGSFVSGFAAHRGPGPGEVLRAGGVGASNEGLVVVADAGSNRLHVYAWPGRGPMLPEATEPLPTTTPEPEPTEPTDEAPTDVPTAEPTQETQPSATASVPPATPQPNILPSPPGSIFLPFASTRRR